MIIGVRMPGDELIPGGLDTEIAAQTARIPLEGVFDEARGCLNGVQVMVSFSGSISDVSLMQPLRRVGLPVHLIGDAKLPRDVVDAVEDAANTVWSLGAERQEIV